MREEQLDYSQSKIFLVLIFSFRVAKERFEDYAYPLVCIWHISCI